MRNPAEIRNASQNIMPFDCKGIIDEEKKDKRNVGKSQPPYNLKPLMNSSDIYRVTPYQELMIDLMLFH